MNDETTPVTRGFLEAILGQLADPGEIAGAFAFADRLLAEREKGDPTRKHEQGVTVSPTAIIVPCRQPSDPNPTAAARQCDTCKWEGLHPDSPCGECSGSAYPKWEPIPCPPATPCPELADRLELLRDANETIDEQAQEIARLKALWPSHTDNDSAHHCACQFDDHGNCTSACQYHRTQTAPTPPAFDVERVRAKVSEMRTRWAVTDGCLADDWDALLAELSRAPATDPLLVDAITAIRGMWANHPAVLAYDARQKGQVKP